MKGGLWIAAGASMLLPRELQKNNPGIAITEQ